MVYFPNAKVNLGLYVTEKRKDGYHNLVSVMLPVAWCDMLEVVSANKFTYSQSGLTIPGKEADNLCVKAYKLLNKDFQLGPVHIHLHKIIPMGAGLGGGSADAAFTLKALNQHFQLYLDNSILEDYAAQLGSDCSFFIENKPALATGRGEILSPINLDLSGYHILLVNPQIAVGTAEAYKGVRPQAMDFDLAQFLSETPMEQWNEQLRNDFEESVFAKYPEIAQLKVQLYEAGASYASMSGSGSTVFGIFKELPAISFPDNYMIWQGKL
ncbi:4-(cytidine 5'-diphospho)-2-C-methyl-D-erythritol kinase [Cytophagales bacterium LB-30]|uniref:4-diphosphocytidyl-2-C-methyl-D-erythritol kinase n=1 Tax=Shiella aurantiaca TaxID=3058365 RepID=A0ABT8F7W7_9BACT|nr:4-(cytidine 5'-diphospho)-2-C-methyl-D-erythritol kinase [Shiella aurantiaca]MDN4166555.1 4-(cytidine 5'-diphospho)-2-C-methyl-D-erythritol kinase [Shiella aurantiaca]